MKIAFVHDWKPDLYQEITWKDGLAAAVKILHERHEVKFFTLGDEDFVLPHSYFPIYVRKGSDNAESPSLIEAVKEFNPDVILVWGDCTRPNARGLFYVNPKMALCFAGGDTTGPTAPYFSHFFVESEVYKIRFQMGGKSVSTAFGTNEKLFRPSELQNKIFDVIFPATFCDWKRHKLFTDAVVGRKAIVTGFMYQDHEVDCWKYPMANGVLTLPHSSAETLRELYAASHTCLITSRADGGSQRTVLEAMAMNLPVVVTQDSDKTSEYVIDAGLFECVAEPTVESIQLSLNWALENQPKTRDYILSKWTSDHYASAIEEGIKKIL